MDSMKKIELQKIINAENGINYHRNVNLSGYTVYRDKSFISFRIMTVKTKQIVVIDYIFITPSYKKARNYCLFFEQMFDFALLLSIICFI